MSSTTSKVSNVCAAQRGKEHRMNEGGERDGGEVEQGGEEGRSTVGCAPMESLVKQARTASDPCLVTRDATMDPSEFRHGLWFKESVC